MVDEVIHEIDQQSKVLFTWDYERSRVALRNDEFQALLFSKIVPNCKKLGLLDAGDGWLRARFGEIGVIQFEDWVDTSEEYASLDEVAKDWATTA
jgi:hypothetical protein